MQEKQGKGCRLPHTLGGRGWGWGGWCGQGEDGKDHGMDGADMGVYVGDVLNWGEHQFSHPLGWMGSRVSIFHPVVLAQTWESF